MQLAASMPLNIHFYRFVLQCCAIELRNSADAQDTLVETLLDAASSYWLQLSLIIEIKINNANHCDNEKFST